MTQVDDVPEEVAAKLDMLDLEVGDTATFTAHDDNGKLYQYTLKLINGTAITREEYERLQHRQKRDD